MTISVRHIALIIILISSSILSQTIIVNKSNSIDKLTKSELHNIYLGNTCTWNNSKQIVLVDYTADNELRESFSQEYLNLSPKRVSMIWIKASLSGKTIPPKVFHTEEEIVKYVSENEGAIGYVSKPGALPNNIKIVNIL